MKVISLWIAVVLVLSCSRSQFNTPQQAVDEGNSSQGLDVSPVGLSVSLATPAQCVAGGQVYSVFLDDDRDGLRDGGESVINEQVVCNGINGNNGADGANGTNGSDGLSMVFQTLIADENQCPAGGTLLVMALDFDRSNSVSGGDVGMQSANICNGLPGAAAPVPDFAPIEMIAACGNNVPYKEILLRLQNGQVLASVSNNTAGDMTRLAFLPDGTFMNTDNSGCVFTLATSGDGQTRSISWSNQVQMTWPVLY